MAAMLADYPPPSDYAHGPDDYAHHIVKVKQAVRIPVIASLNGHTGESWLKFARIIEQAGADALEFNYYDIATSLMVPSAAIEEHLVNAVTNLTRAIAIPVAVKLTPFYTAFGHLAAALDRAGASGLVLFNRFYQSNVDTRAMTLVPQAELSTNAELALRLHWLALLHGRVRPRCGKRRGRHARRRHQGAARRRRRGAAGVRPSPARPRACRGDAAGPRALAGVAAARLQAAMIGRASFETSPNPAALERAHYIRTLQSWTRSPHS